MERTEVEKRVKSVIAKVLKTDEAALVPAANFIFDLGADSAQSLELVAGFEEEFDIEMKEDEALAVQTVEGAVDFISQIVG